jgi:hypothetical protein
MTLEPKVCPIQQIEALAKRLEKARQLVAEKKVHPLINLENHYVVEASSGFGFYLVNGACTCQDAKDRSELHRGFCKHRLAVEIYKEQPKEEKPKASPNAKGSTKDEREHHEREIADLFPSEKEKGAHSHSS